MSAAPNVNSESIRNILTDIQQDNPQQAIQLVDALLNSAHQAGASDLHFQPAEDTLQLKWRVDGVLHSLGVLPKQTADKVVVRLKVLAKLLTYQTQVPQEGRIASAVLPFDVRVSTFPTIFGEKVVARLLPTSETSYSQVADLGLSTEIAQTLIAALSQTAGALLIVGPAGSGKTTTAYACLREIVANSHAQRNIVSVEDPVESILEDVAQSQVAESVGFDLTSGLRSLVRQDPDVIFVGEIRDPTTARIAFQAALTGQLVITTFHAPDAATALSRIADMGVPDYVLRGAINSVIGQQLVRRLCKCATTVTEDNEAESNFGLPVQQWSVPSGCPQCQETGYVGRILLAELLDLKNQANAVQVRTGADAQQIRAAAIANGMKTLYQQAVDLVAARKTSPAEIVRVFGIAGQND